MHLKFLFFFFFFFQVKQTKRLCNPFFRVVTHKLRDVGNIYWSVSFLKSWTSRPVCFSSQPAAQRGAAAAWQHYTKQNVAQSSVALLLFVFFFFGFLPNICFLKEELAATCPQQKRNNKNSGANVIIANAQRSPVAWWVTQQLCAANPSVCAAGSFDKWSCQHSVTLCCSSKTRVCRARRLTSTFAHLALSRVATRSVGLYATQRGRLCRWTAEWRKSSWINQNAVASLKN